MSLNADRTINRAMVAECAISATRKYLKLHMPKNIKSPLEQPSCQNAKVVQAVCDAAYRRSPPCLVRQPPVDALGVPDEMLTARNSHMA
jgi:hypothetical protein